MPFTSILAIQATLIHSNYTPEYCNVHNHSLAYSGELVQASEFIVLFKNYFRHTTHARSYVPASKTIYCVLRRIPHSSTTSIKSFLLVFNNALLFKSYLERSKTNTSPVLTKSNKGQKLTAYPPTSLWKTIRTINTMRQSATSTLPQMALMKITKVRVPN